MIGQGRICGCVASDVTGQYDVDRITRMNDVARGGRRAAMCVDTQIYVHE